MTTAEFSAESVAGIGEIRPGDDLCTIVGDAIADSVEEGDIVVVTSKIVSKAEGRVVAAADREGAIAQETVRLVAERRTPAGTTRIVENKLGLVQAAAGVDASNTPEGTVLLLPEDPDRTAHEMCLALRERLGRRIGVIVTDTMGRPWRIGQTDVAIGAAGVRVLDNLRGAKDDFGRELAVTNAALADEIAGAANLLAGKTSRRPVTLVHGLGHLVLDDEALASGTERPRARDIIRPSEEDLFRVGTQEAYEAGRAAAMKEAAE
jgi:coenzyme F420-0:L-glutamate ligase/coenzyme F420-1:gamma-L-glutamate ligase